ncbi:MAG: DUF3267 domain-containing protein [Bacteroidales bacterium]|nr:DUF3267 domain-containing protein [Bacteroidales bacterium]
MKTPSADILHEDSQYELIARVHHDQIRDFVVDQVVEDKKLVPTYMVYQSLMVFSGLFFLTRAVILAWKGDAGALTVALLALLFSFTLLVVIHELLHGLALMLAGAPRIRYGGSLRKFIFYAEADRFVLGRPAFLFVAFTPLAVIQIVSVAGILLWFPTPFVYFFLMLQSAHALFCAGDLALATIFFKYPGRKVYTYDNRDERCSYYFVENEKARENLAKS